VAAAAHKLDAPAANNVDKASVVVSINASAISLRAEHPTKTLQLSFPLRHAVDPLSSTYAVSTFGVTLTLRKRELQHAWGDLLPDGWPRTRSSAVWWELKQTHEAAMNEVNKRGASVKWCTLAAVFFCLETTCGRGWVQLLGFSRRKVHAGCLREWDIATHNSPSPRRFSRRVLG
jgi:hypothetical protein